MTKQPFGTWFKQFKGSGTPFSDLAEDMISDLKVLGKTPSYFKTPEQLYSRMSYVGACTAAINVLVEAAEMYGEPLDLEDDDEDY